MNNNYLGTLLMEHLSFVFHSFSVPSEVMDLCCEESCFVRENGKESEDREASQAQGSSHLSFALLKAVFLWASVQAGFLR